MEYAFGGSHAGLSFCARPNVRSWPDLHVDGDLLTIALFENQVVLAQEARTRLPVEDAAPQARSDWKWDALAAGQLVSADRAQRDFYVSDLLDLNKASARS